MKLNQEWYVLHTKSRFENVVNDGLTKKRFEAFLPKVKVLSKRRDRKKWIHIPLFPGYVFVKSKLDANEHLEIVKTVGVVRVIGNNKGPLSVPKNTIESLQIMVSSNELITTGTQYVEGDHVMVVSGPFVGVSGIFSRYKGKGRILVNIEALGQFASVEVDEKDVERQTKIMG